MINPFRVLIIGLPDADAQNLICELERGGYALHIVHIGPAIRFNESYFSPRPDMIVLDYDFILPFNSQQNAMLIRGIPFIIISDSIDEERIGKAFQSGASDFLLKDKYSRVLPIIERERHKQAERESHRENESQLRSDNRRLITLRAIEEVILNDATPEMVCNYVLLFISSEVNIISGKIVMFESDSSEAVVLANYHRSPEAQITAVGDRFPIETINPADLADLSNGQTRHVPYLDAETPVPCPDESEVTPVKSYLLLPIPTREGLIGAVMLFSDIPNPFSKEQITSSAEIAHQLAIVIRQKRFVAEIQRNSAELEQRVLERTKALHQATHRMAAILNNTSDAIIVTDAQGHIQETNPAFRELFGYYGDNMIGFGISQMFDFEEKGLLEEALKAAVTFGSADNIEATGIRANGTDFKADIAVVSLMENGVLENIVYSVRNVTRRKQVEQELRVMLEQQRELNELKSRFVSMASHEFRTPLAIIRTTADMLGAYRQRMDDATIDMRLDKIRAQVTHMATLMDDVLTLARDQAGKSLFDPEMSDIDVFCRDIVEQIRVDPDTTHEIIYSCTPQPLNIMFDKTQMRKIVNNLLSNAIKYSPQSASVRFTITQQGNFVTLKVSDSGYGIPEADQKHLFEAFHRGSNVGMVSGTGLGLTITKQAVEAHGGSLRFESKLNEGTTFFATIPVELNREG